MTRFSSIAIVSFLCLSLMIAAAGAVVQEVTVQGTVATLSESKNTLSINNPAQYGCDYGSGDKAPVCTYKPMSVSVLTGTVPDAAAFAVFKPGDPIVATSIGGAGETWIALAKLYGSTPNEAFVTNVIGDPSTIPTPLIGDYSLGLNTSPDCTQCSGTSCTAKSSDVTVFSTGTKVFENILLPGQSLNFNGRNDGSSVAVTFVKGQALSSSCPQVSSGMVGWVQPVSVYVATVVPPIGYSQVNIRTATTTRPDEALTTIATASPVVTTPVSTMAPVSTAATPTKAASLPFIAAGALAVAGLLFVYRKQ